MFILKKKIDWSLLTAGLTIPVEFQPIIQQLKGGVVEKGMTRTIKIIIGQDVFEAKLTNVNFDRKKYQTHSDLLQIRYTDNSPIAKKLQMIFSNSFSYLKFAKQLPENRHKQIKLPDDGWVIVNGKTDNLKEIYDKIYLDGPLTYELETFTNDGNCTIKYYR
jgi:ribosomal protein S17